MEAEQNQNKDQQEQEQKQEKKPKIKKFSPVKEMNRLYPEPDYIIKTRPPMWDDWRLNIWRGMKENKLKLEANKIARRKCWETGEALEECSKEQGMFKTGKCKKEFNSFLNCCNHEREVELDKLRRDTKRHSEWWWLCLYDEEGEIGKQAEWKPEEKVTKMFFKNILYNMIFKPTDNKMSDKQHQQRLEELRKKQGYDLASFNDEFQLDFHIDINKAKEIGNVNIDKNIYNNHMSQSPKEMNGNGEKPEEDKDNERERPRSPSNQSDRSRDKRQDKRDKDEDNFTQIYIAKLHPRSTDNDLRQEFAKYGTIKDVVLKRSYAFVDFEEHDAAVKAIEEMNGKTFVNGEELIIEQSVPGGKKRGAGPKKEDVCFNCQKKGHWANECRSRKRSRSRNRSRSRSNQRRYRRSSRSRSPPRRNNRQRSRSHGRKDSKSRDMKEGRCFECGQRGHIKRDCPEIRGGKGRSRSPPQRGKRMNDRRKKSKSYSSSRSRGKDRSRSRGKRRRSPSSRKSSRSPPSKKSYSPQRNNPEEVKE